MTEEHAVTFEDRARRAGVAVHEVDRVPPPLTELVRRGRRRQIVHASSGVLAALVLSALAGGMVLSTRTTRLVAPASVQGIEGRWVTDVAESAVRHEQVPAGSWSLTITAQSLVAQPTTTANDAVIETITADQTRHRLTMLTNQSTQVFQFACSSSGTYSWRVNSGRLTLTAIADPCRARRLLFDTEWKRP